MTRAPVIALFLLLSSVAAAAAGPERYEVRRARASADSLLAAEGSAWKPARKISWGPRRHRTSFRGLWNDEGLYVLFEARDADPWHTLTRRDEPLWNEEVVEIFLDPDRSGRHYAEIEISPANVLVDAHILTPLPMNDGEPPWKGDFAWTLEGLESRVAVHTARGRTSGWTAAAFLPWAGLRSLPSTAKVALPPRAGDAWRFNVFRIERPEGRDGPVVLLPWSPAPIPRFHVPSAFRDLVFD